MKRILLLAGIVIAIVVVWRLIITIPKNLKRQMNYKASTLLSNDIQAGARRTYPFSLPEAWDYLVSPAGVGTWLGVDGIKLSPGTTFRNERIQGEIKIVKDLSHIRMVWKRSDWPSYSTLQVRVFRADSGATISFHQDKLGSEAVRHEMLLHWQSVLSKVGEKFRFSEN